MVIGKDPDLHLGAFQQIMLHLSIVMLSLFFPLQLLFSRCSSSVLKANLPDVLYVASRKV